MPKVDVAGLKLDAITKAEFLGELHSRIARKEQAFVVTPYSEFLYSALRDPKLMALFNSADISIVDGIGVLWAHRYLSIPLTRKSYLGKIFQAVWQMVYSGAGILLAPKTLYKTFPEKITGADVVWDIARLASEKNYSIYLLGAQGDIAQRAGEKLRAKYHNLKVAGSSNKSPGQEAEIIPEINQSGADILFVAYGPPRQEQWIFDNKGKLTTKVMVGLGGTFDYITGERSQPPRFMRRIGLEWLFRLITQPSRLIRIKRGVLDLIIDMVRYKLL
jgi:N-acetylglucosaminyldiphosphoundecaprenol N-acetyl-beta-D-mannosaminyltransferase